MTLMGNGKSVTKSKLSQYNNSLQYLQINGCMQTVTIIDMSQLTISDSTKIVLISDYHCYLCCSFVHNSPLALQTPLRFANETCLWGRWSLELHERRVGKPQNLQLQQLSLCPTDFFILKHSCSILRQLSNPVCGFSMMEQFKL